MENRDVTKAKSALEIYIKGLLQDYMNETGACIEQVEIKCAIHPDTQRRFIQQVKVLEPIQTLSAAFH
jgi:hypothetical protein